MKIQKLFGEMRLSAANPFSGTDLKERCTSEPLFMHVLVLGYIQQGGVAEFYSLHKQTLIPMKLGHV